ncbi:hypothetical protein R1flu_019739 [Riccia fluitans]|uniref:Uncharacterized protein n=1 Tax=Riccia fluitans TaxID=41844 RepID=A0ABD1ZL38_9MARC
MTFAGAGAAGCDLELIPLKVGLTYQTIGLNIDEDRKRRCRGKIFALEDCQRKYRKEPERGMMCKHLNHAAALCLLSCVCPEEVESVQYQCASQGPSSNISTQLRVV